MNGVEINSDLIKWIDIKCRIKQVPSSLYSLELLGGDNNLPYDDESFDHVISLGVLELLGDRPSAKYCIGELARVLKPGGKMIVSTLHPENYFVTNSKQVDNEKFHFKGREVDKETQLEYDLYIPKTDESFSSIFPENCTVEEIGSWNNVYCGVNGKHFCALVTKK